jgi:hypothetical protein
VMKKLALLSRLWAFDRIRQFDDWLHRIDAPGRWWCDATDWLLWKLLPLDRPAGLP